MLVDLLTLVDRFPLGNFQVNITPIQYIQHYITLSTFILMLHNQTISHLEEIRDEAADRIEWQEFTVKNRGSYYRCRRF